MGLELLHKNISPPALDAIPTVQAGIAEQKYSKCLRIIVILIMGIVVILLL
jgi:hypothetical protein